MKKPTDLNMEVTKLNAQQVLTSFQLIEFVVKKYISKCYSIARLKLDGILYFGFADCDIDKLALGQALAIFAKFNNNTNLHARLRQLMVDRNILAHSFYANLLLSEAFNHLDITKAKGHLEKLTIETQDILEALLDEATRIEAIPGKPLEEPFQTVPASALVGKRISPSNS